MEKDNKLFSLLNSIEVNNEPIRNIYNGAIKYNFNEESPLEIRETKIDRYMVNHIRHNYSNYENGLRIVHRLNNNNDVGYHLYKNAVLSAIAISYPSLKEECDVQKTYLEMIKPI